MILSGAEFTTLRVSGAEFTTLRAGVTSGKGLSTGAKQGEPGYNPSDFGTGEGPGADHLSNGTPIPHIQAYNTPLTAKWTS